jgi:hypothetical protein
MADEEDTGLPVEVWKSDVPKGSSLAIATPNDAKALVRRMSGEDEPDRCRFHCVMCGWNGTLHFDADEIAALGDVREYTGPCQKCNSQTLQPHDQIANGAFKSIHEMASTNRKKEFGEAADVFIEKVQSRVGDMFGGVAMPGSTLGQDPAPPSSGPSREHLPEADDVDLTNMKPRKG